MNDILDDVHNETDTYDGDMVGKRWIMDAEELKCVDCEGLDTEHGKKWKKHIGESIHHSLSTNIEESIHHSLPTNNEK
jgi:hypothetical protein